MENNTVPCMPDRTEPQIDKEYFIHYFYKISNIINQIANDHGFWEDNRSDGESIALMHSELSEALEALRHGNPDSDKIPTFSNLEEELADCIIRIMDYGYQKDLDIGHAIIAKMEHNESRPYKHGKEF